MYGQTPILLSVALLALIGSLPRFLEKEVEEAVCPGSEPGSGPCAVPFLSLNPLTLRCPGAEEAEEGSVHWQYLNLSLSQPEARPRTFIGPRGVRAQRGPLTHLSRRALVRGGALLLARARPSDSGLYLCKAGASTLGAYRVDVQDAALLHVSHRGLGQQALGNQSVRLQGGRLRLHTRWGPWQDCDRCGATGERKRLGFCYAALRAEEAEAGDGGEEAAQQPPGPEAAELPCGLMQLRLGQALPRRGPELRYETCRRDCGAAHDACQLAAQARELLLGEDGRAPAAGPGYEPRAAAAPREHEPRALLLLETLLLEPHEDARLTCPGASVYTPVSWQRDAALVTRLDLLRRCNGSHSLDEATGGGAYRIAGVRRSDQGVYRCWVRGRRAAAFHLEVPDLPPRRRLHSRKLLGALRAVLASFALVFVVSALAELLHSCWCEVL